MRNRAPTVQNTPNKSANPAQGATAHLLGHVAVVLLQSVLFANTAWLMPLLVRLHFGSPDPVWRDWQTTLVTASVPTLMMLSIFWGALLERLPLRAYLLAYWLAAAVPLGVAGWAQNYWQFLACHMVAAAGVGSWTPLNGKLLKQLYPDSVRGRVYALLNAVTLIGAIASVFVFGAWMEAEPEAFRRFLPVAAAVQLVGVLVLLRLTPERGAHAPRADRPAASVWRAVLGPVRRMGQVLRSDRTFQRYEIAFMTYGGAYMFCDAILPVLATDRLGMRYQEFAHSTQVVSRVATLAAMLPMGWLLDRIGPVRTSGLSFAWLAIYPVLLLAATGFASVALASALWGIAMAGVLMGWMLGPVSLARTPEQVPEYVAIHATLVGVRGILFQGIGMLLYKLTGSFSWPLIAASLFFAWAAWQMWRLHSETVADRREAAISNRAAPVTIQATTVPCEPRP